MAVVIGHNMLPERHHYDDFPSYTAMPRNQQKMSHDAFRATPEGCSLPLKGIAGVSTKAPYYSPVALDTGKPAADLVMLKERLRHNINLKNADMNLLCNVGRPVVFWRDTEALSAFQWHIGLGSCKGSDGLAWPVQLLPVPGSTLLKVELCDKAAEPKCLPITEWASITARATAWKAWAWQTVLSQMVAVSRQPGVRLFVMGEGLPVLQLAAKQAWRDLVTSELAMVADASDIPLEKGQTHLDMLVQMTCHVLNLDAMTRQQLRMA